MWLMVVIPQSGRIGRIEQNPRIHGLDVAVAKKLIVIVSVTDLAKSPFIRRLRQGWNETAPKLRPAPRILIIGLSAEEPGLSQSQQLAWHCNLTLRNRRENR